MAVYVILMGMQGAGKGTQADKLKEWLNVPHVTSGGIFRTNIGQGTPLGIEAKGYVDAGKLVPDDLTIRMIKERLQQDDAKNGVLLDGFPRTVAQAQALDTLMKELGQSITMVPYLVISEAEAMERLGGRMVCSKDDQHAGGYHVKNKPPKVTGICDVCGAHLIVRKDDTPEAIKKRVELYKSETTPVLDYYRNAGLLREINAEQPVETVTADLKAAIEAVVR